MPSVSFHRPLVFLGLFALLVSTPSTFAQVPSPENAAPSILDGLDADVQALVLARQTMEGGERGREALLKALAQMGWSVRDAKGVVIHPAPANADTGLAFRDYEMDELLWKPAEQPAIRLISFAQALAVPFEDADPEELAQDLVDTVRQSLQSDQPQQRFWAHFIVALGRVSPTNFDLSQAGSPDQIPPSKAQLREWEKQVASNPLAFLTGMTHTPVWPETDPVLAPSPKPEREEEDSRESATERDQKRLEELGDEMVRLSEELGQADEAKRKVAQEKYARLGTEMAAISQRMQAANVRMMAESMKRIQQQAAGEADDDEDTSSDPRFLSEHRDVPLSLLQVALLTRVVAADLRLLAAKSAPTPRQAGLPVLSRGGLPLAMITVAQAAPSFGDQFAGAAGDIWATGWGAYTGAVLEHHLPNSKFGKGVGIANTIIAWFKTIMSVARQNITIEVENAPLVRTKTRAPGEQRTARAKVEIDFPKSDVLKAIRAAGNLATIDLQLPDGGPVSGAKVVWRLTEGSYNNKYQTAKGGWEYRPEFAVVQFAEAGSKAAYVSTTNEMGEATITIEGVPQRRLLPPTVRPYPRRAAIAVEVTIKVGNLTQDLNDAINTAMGGPISGGLSFIADMVLRTSFFFQKGRVFEVTDWKEPAWQGEIEISVKGSGSKRQKPEKGGPEAEYTWKMDRFIEGRLHTPDWDEENEESRNYDNDGRHRLELDGDSRYFRLRDSSTEKSRTTNNRYEAEGPLQIQPPGQNQLTTYSRAEPSGQATLTFNGGFMMLELSPFFGAECLVYRSEQSGKRSSVKAGPEYLSLLGDVYPTTFSIIEPNDGTRESVEGTKTIEAMGSLPYVPSFDVQVTIKYRLWKNNPPPKNKAR